MRNDSTILNKARLLLAVLPMMVGLAACGPAEKDKLAGERIPILSFENQISEDPRLKDEAITIPPAFRNNAWPNMGGFASHAAYHLELAALTPLFKVSIVEGNSRDVRMKAPPIVAEDKVFVLGAGLNVVAVDANTGGKLWTQSVMADYSEPNLGWTRFLGFKEKPADIEDGFGGGLAYDNGRLFVTTGFGEVLCLSATTGEILWRVRNVVAFSNAPTVRNGRVFVVSQDSRLQAFSVEDGTRLWEYLAITELATIIGASSPAVSDQFIVAGFNSGEVVALSPVNGTVAWSDSLTSRATQITPLAQLNAIVGSPVIDRDRVFATSHGGRTAAFGLRTGERIWTVDIGSIEMPWAMGDYVLVTTLDGAIVCLSRGQGRIKWISQLQAFENPKTRETRVSWSNPILAGGRVVVASSIGDLVALSPETGDIIQTHKLREPINLSPVLANGTLYVLSDEGTLFAWR